VSVGLGVAAILLPVQVFLGDAVANHVFPYQASKAQAAEGHWTSGNTAFIIFAIPDQQAQRNIAQVSIPCVDSAFYKDLSCKTGIPGLDLTPKADQPMMAPVFWGFRLMFYASLLMFGTVFYATILRFRRKLWTSPRFHRFLVWSTPVDRHSERMDRRGDGSPAVGSIRHLRTSAAVSQLAPGEILFSVLGFSLLYLVMLAGYLAYIVRTMRIGPERDHPDLINGSRATAVPVPAAGSIAPEPASGR
jgi:cytochrome d ubiquinol oxidase subunit I